MMANDTFVLMNHLQWSQAHIVGASMGGMIALELASMYPDHIASLSLLVTHASIYSYLQSMYHQWRSMVKLFACRFLQPEQKAATMLDLLYPRDYLDVMVPVEEQETEGRHWTNQTRREKLYLMHLNNMKKSHPMGRNVVGAKNQMLAVLTHHVSSDRLHVIRDKGFPIMIIGSRQDALIHVGNTDRLYTHLASNHTTKVIFPDAGHAVSYQERHTIATLLISTCFKRF